MDSSKRINQVIDFYGLNAKTFSERIGYSRPQIIYDLQKGKTKRISEDLASKIVSVFENVSKTWLLVGEGSMLKDEEEQSGELVPLLPVSAHAGHIEDFTASVRLKDCERIISPIHGADVAMSVIGNSMLPRYQPGSILFLKKIDEKLFLEWGKVYVLDTENGSLVKKLMPTNSPNVVSCVSLNPDYPPFNVDLTNVSGVYRILANLIAE